MPQKYVSKAKRPKVWHSDKYCIHRQASDGLVPADDDEIPDEATPCSTCAGGINPEKIREMVSDE